MTKWRLRFEFWETQGLCYVILSYQIEVVHPTISGFLFWYGMFCFACAIWALSKDNPTS